MTLQEKIMQELNVKPSIEPKQEIEKRVGFLKSYLKKTGAKGFVLGISGGQDSTLAGRLAQLAVEELREEGIQAEFIAVRLPYGVQQDEDDAQLALKFIQPDKSFAFDIASTVGSFAAQYQSVTGEALADFHKGNVKARVRMITQYAIGGQNQSAGNWDRSCRRSCYRIFYEIRRRGRRPFAAYRTDKAPGQKPAGRAGSAGAALYEVPDRRFA